MADDCTGQADHSWHLYRDNAGCDTYYQCGREGDGILRSDLTCTEGQVFNVTTATCSAESTCFVRECTDIIIHITGYDYIVNITNNIVFIIVCLKYS